MWINNAPETEEEWNTMRNIKILVKSKKEIRRNEEKFILLLDIASPRHILSMSIHHGHFLFDLFRCKFCFIDFSFFTPPACLLLYFSFASLNHEYLFCIFNTSEHQAFTIWMEKGKKGNRVRLTEFHANQNWMSFIPKRICWGQFDYFMYSGLRSVHLLKRLALFKFQMLNHWNLCMDNLINFNLLIITNKICEVVESQFSRQLLKDCQQVQHDIAKRKLFNSFSIENECETCSPLETANKLTFY